MLHAADFLRVPGVGLFGPTSPHQFGFRLARHVHIRGGESMADICEDEVLEALETMAEGGSYLRDWLRASVDTESIIERASARTEKLAGF